MKELLRAITAAQEKAALERQKQQAEEARLDKEAEQTLLNPLRNLFSPEALSAWVALPAAGTMACLLLGTIACPGGPDFRGCPSRWGTAGALGGLGLAGLVALSLASADLGRARQRLDARREQQAKSQPPVA